MRFGLIDDNEDEDDLKGLSDAWIANNQTTDNSPHKLPSLSLTPSKPQPIPGRRSELAASTSTALSPSAGYTSNLANQWHSPHSFNSFRCPSSEDDDSSDDDFIAKSSVIGTKGYIHSDATFLNTQPSNESHTGTYLPVELSYEPTISTSHPQYASPVIARINNTNPIPINNSPRWNTPHRQYSNSINENANSPQLIGSPSMASTRSTPRSYQKQHNKIATPKDPTDEPEAVLMKYVNYVDTQEIIIKEAKKAGQAAAADKAIQVRLEKSRIREESIKNQENYLYQIHQATEEATKALDRLLLSNDEKEKQAESSLAMRKQAAFSKLDGALAQLEKEREEEMRKKKAEEELRLKEQEQQEQQRREKEAKQQAKHEAERKEAAIADEKSKRTRSATTDMLASIMDFNQRIKPETDNNPAFKKLCFEGRMKIKPKIGQITNTKSQIDRIVNELDQLFSQSQQMSPNVYYSLLNFFSKAVVKQAETEVRVKFSSAFPLARMCVALFMRHPQLVKLMIGRLMKNCTYLIPHYVARQPGQSDETYRKILGYASNDEEVEQYKERMCGIVALFSAIVQTTPADGGINPYGMMYGWRWLACILNQPAHSITPMLINTFLEVAGPALLETYRDQARKLIAYIIEDYMGRLSSKSPAANSRLQSFLEAYLASGQIKEISGRQYA
ncbi:GLE1-like protein-domain-containing protein [Syncephalis fuscata]|nr:GLE1-like protein-domain-containing protein [Syncephalis fuscata]